MMFGRDARETRDQLSRLEATLEEQHRVGAEQQATLATIAAQLAQLEQTLAARGQRVETGIAALGDAVNQIPPELGPTLSGIEQSSARTGRAGKRVAKSIGKLGTQLKRIQARLARVGGTYDVDIDARFLEVADPLRESRRTMLGYDRLFTLWQAAGNVARLELAVVEIGTFRGGSAALLAEALKTFAGSPGEVHVVDTFEGHIDSTFTAHDVAAQRGKFRGTSFDDVREFLGAYPGVHVYQGDAAAVIREWPERRYGLVHIDVDLYGPTRDCLDYFGPRLATGGVLVMDDYDSPTCPGVSVAVQEFLSRHPGFQTWKLQAEQMVLVRIGDQGRPE